MTKPEEGRRRRRGFSLAELLVVVLILGIAAMVGISQVSKALKRQRLASCAGDLCSLAQRSLLEMQNRNLSAFLVFEKWRATGTLVRVAVDTNGSGAYDAGTDLVLQTLTLPAEIALSETASSGQTFVGAWQKPTSGDVTAVLLCDFLGRAATPVTAAPLAAPATVPLTHSEMISGSLTPSTVFTLTINPLWNASLRRVP